MQGDDFSVLLYAISVERISWAIRSSEGYRLTHEKNDKVTHLLFVDDLKSYTRSEQTLVAGTQTLANIFDDIGLGINLGKCAACHIKRGKFYKDADLPIGDDQIENCNQLDSLVHEEARRVYLRRLSVIWTSPLTIPRKIQATNVFANTMMEYYMTTNGWRIADMRELDRRSREIFTANGARPIAESTALMYIPIEDGGKGFKSIEGTYKIAKIKAAHHINTSDDPRVKLVKTFQKQKEKKICEACS